MAKVLGGVGSNQYQKRPRASRGGSESITLDLAPTISSGALTRMSKDPDVFSRIQAAENPATPPAVLAGLLSDGVIAVRDAARRNPSLVRS